jgi:hypothetical protein
MLQRYRPPDGPGYGNPFLDGRRTLLLSSKHRPLYTASLTVPMLAPSRCNAVRAPELVRRCAVSANRAPRSRGREYTLNETECCS